MGGSDVSEPGPYPSSSEVIEVHFLGIGLAFEDNVPVCTVMSPVAEDIDTIIEEIKKIKRDNKHFELLAEMYTLVIHQGFIVNQISLPEEEQRKECQCPVIP